MKLHTTNYYNTFMEISDDCPVREGQKPPEKEGRKTIANYQFELIWKSPYRYTSDDIIFTVHAIRSDIPEIDWPQARKIFFSKGQACLRTSPLAKRYGWGIHHDANGRVALYAADSDAYQAFLEDSSVPKKKAMRSKR